MSRNFSFSRVATSLRPTMCLAFTLIALAFAVTAADQRVRLIPKFVPGQTLRYRIETRSTTTGKTTLPIVNPEGGTRATQAIHLLIRLDVLPAPPASSATVAPVNPVRLRATYEKSGAESQGDTFDPDATSLPDQYARLENRSIEFTVGPNGSLSDLHGMEDIAPDGSAAAPTLPWLQALASGNSIPRDGIAIGQKWTTERPLAGAPLAGLTWRTQSTYLRNEPCPPSAALPLPGVNGMCAVVLTRFEISRRGSPRSDATPDDYLHNGLRTSGSWTGSGQSLDSISLATGLLVSSTQTSTQDMDYQITSATSGSTLRHQGQTQTQSEITLLPPLPPSSSPHQ